jgi:hypothetical protein
MTAIQISWSVFGGALLLITIALGWAFTGHPLGVLIDSRGRYSLTHLQITIWSIVILSLILGAFAGRWVARVPNPLDFTIPTEVLALMGISLGSTVFTTAVKAGNDSRRPESVAASMDNPSGIKGAKGRSTFDNDGVPFDKEWKPRLRQIFLLEEGSYADKVVDIAKYQQLIITIVLAVAYIGLAFRAAGVVDPATFSALPALGSTFLVLLAASHGAYIAGKMPKQAGSPDMTVASRNQKMHLARHKKTVRQAVNALTAGREPADATRLHIWSDEDPVVTISAGSSLAVTSQREFLLKWRTFPGGAWETVKSLQMAGGYVAVVNRIDGSSDSVSFLRQYIGSADGDDVEHTIRVKKD